MERKFSVLSSQLSATTAGLFLLRTENWSLRIHRFRPGLHWLGGFLFFCRAARHHPPPLLAYLFNRVLLRGVTQLGEFLAALLVLFDPFLGELAVLDLLQHFFHRLAGFVSYNFFAAREVAVFCRVRNRVTHAAQPAFVDQVDDQLHLMDALEVGNLGSVAGRDQRLESFLHQRSQAAAEHRLFAEQVAFGFFFKGGLQHTGAGRTDAVRIAEREFARASAGILVNGQQRGDAAALGIDAAHQVTRTLGRDHDHIHILRRLDGLEVNGEAVREAENLSFVQMRLDGRFVEVGLGLVGRENLEPVGALGSLGRRQNGHAIGACLLGRAARGIEPDDDVVSAVTQVLRLGVSLGPVTENGDGFALEGGRIGIVLIKDCGHWKTPYGCRLKYRSGFLKQKPTARSVSEMLPFQRAQCQAERQNFRYPTPKGAADFELTVSLKRYPDTTIPRYHLL